MVNCVDQYRFDDGLNKTAIASVKKETKITINLIRYISQDTLQINKVKELAIKHYICDTQTEIIKKSCISQFNANLQKIKNVLESIENKIIFKYDYNCDSTWIAYVDTIHKEYFLGVNYANYQEWPNNNVIYLCESYFLHRCFEPNSNSPCQFAIVHEILHLLSKNNKDYTYDSHLCEQRAIQECECHDKNALTIYHQEIGVSAKNAHTNACVGSALGEIYNSFPEYIFFTEEPLC